MQDALNAMRDKDGKLPAFVWPGGYPVMYLATDNGVLCPQCANDYTPGRDTEEQLRPVAYFIHWEGKPETCEHCGAEVDSAYGTEEN